MKKKYKVVFDTSHTNIYNIHKRIFGIWVKTGKYVVAHSAQEAVERAKLKVKPDELEFYVEK